MNLPLTQGDQTGSVGKGAIRSEQAQQLYKGLPAALVVHVLLALLLLSVYSPFIAPVIAYSWFALMLVVLAWRLMGYLSYRRSTSSSEKEIANSLLRFRIGAFGMGMIWGATSWIFFPLGQQPQQIVFAFILIGVNSGAITSLAVDRKSALSFVLPGMLPLVAYFLSQPNLESLVLASVTVLYVVFVSISVFRTEQYMKDNVRLRYEAVDREKSLRRQHQLDEMLLRYEFIANTVSEMMTVVNREHHYEAVNDQWCLMLGRDRTSTIGHHLSEVWGEEKYQTYIAPRIEECMRGHKPVTYQEIIDLPRLGSRECLVVLYPYSNKDGRVTHIIIVTKDMTTQIETERALVAAKEEAEQANTAKSEFLSSMSHELRTPMNAILGFGQLLEYDDSLGEEQKDNVQEIIRAGNHLLKLINEVLDLARIESGRIDLTLDKVLLSPVVEECLGLTGALATERHIQLSHTGLDGLALLADEIRLKQILLNLLSNAIKYNREGGKVVIEARSVTPGRLRLQVTDTGPGIPAEDLVDIFQPFNRLGAENSGIEGTGIGLTLTQQMVVLMDGTIGVESHPGKGSTFWFELPVVSISEPSGAREDVETAPSQMQTKESPSFKVLYIEDNPANLLLVEQILHHRSSVQLISAHTPELGIELARSDDPDLILLDINLPGMDGYQVMERFQMEEGLTQIPVIAVTANAMPKDIERGKAAGFSDYLTKPLNVAKFLETIDHYLLAHDEDRG